MAAPTRILQLTASLRIGGAEQMILGLAEDLHGGRFDIRICCLFPPTESDFAQAGREPSVPVDHIGIKRFYDPRTFLAVARYVRRHEIDVLHTHVLDADVVGQVVGRLVRRPVITTLHSIPRSYALQPRRRRWSQRLAVRYLGTRLVTVSKTAQAAFVREWKVPESRMSTIYPGVPLQHFLAIPQGRPARGPDDPFVVTNVGRLVPAKAQHILLMAAQQILQMRRDVQFVFVGPGPRAAELAALALELGIEQNVTWMGPQHDVAAILAASDVFALSSLWESLPLSAVEAMASARPVVVTDVGGCRELVEDGVRGLVVPPGNATALAAAVLSLIGDDERRQSLGVAAREHVRTTYGSQRMAAEYRSLYDEVARASG